MCKPDKSLNTGVQTSYLSSHERGFEKNQPYRRSDWTSRLWGCPKNVDCLRLFKTTRERRALSLLSLDSLELWNSSKLRFPFSRLRPPTRAGPLDAHLGTNHRRGAKTVPKPWRSHEFDDCRGELSRWRHAAVSSLHTRATEGARTTHVASEDKELNSRGKTKPKSNSLLHFNNRQQV